MVTVFLGVLMDSIERFLKEICEAPGVSGYEQPVAQLIKAGMCDYADEVREDRLGNLIFKKGTGENRPRILLAAHMDEIGFMITKIEENGFLRLLLLAELIRGLLLVRKY